MLCFITLRNPLLRGKTEHWTEKNTLYRVLSHFPGPLLQVKNELWPEKQHIIAPKGLLCGKRSKNPCPSPRPSVLPRKSVVLSKPTSTRDMIFSSIYSCKKKKVDFGTFNSWTLVWNIGQVFFQSFLKINFILQLLFAKIQIDPFWHERSARRHW